jgi:hypothetical protein
MVRMGCPASSLVRQPWRRTYSDVTPKSVNDNWKVPIMWSVIKNVILTACAITGAVVAVKAKNMNQIGVLHENVYEHSL